jgi:phosphoenolpyruvate carboxykinase (GTP)
VETPVGIMPADDAIDRPAGVSAEDMRKLIEVDLAGWKAELDDVKAGHYPKFGAKLPKELSDLLDTIMKRL